MYKCNIKEGRLSHCFYCEIWKFVEKVELGMKISEFSHKSYHQKLEMSKYISESIKFLYFSALGRSFILVLEFDNVIAVSL